MATALTSASGCGDAVEAPRVTLPVAVDATDVVPVTTDLGYVVEVSALRVVVQDIVFTTAGEAHTASLMDQATELLVPLAHAHPGHAQGGEVIGELPGTFVIDWTADDGLELGDATLLAGDYTAANFTFARGDAASLGAEDPLAGHTAIISGTAERDGTTWAFTIVVDSPEGRELIGAPFEAVVAAASTAPIGFRFDTTDPLEGDTVFDGLDFAALAVDAVVQIVPDAPESEDAYNHFRRVFQTHDHYSFVLQE